MSIVRKTVFHLCGATGGGARGFKRARVQIGQMKGEWVCVGSVDIDARANGVFSKRLGVPATTLDLADRGQYIAINGHEPPAGWREATPDDIRRAAHGVRPDCCFISAPCKGLSGLLPKAMSLLPKYLAMNQLSERALFLALTAWADDPVPLYVLENVPRLLTTGGEFADELVRMFQAFGYAVQKTVHDCGEVGGLGQSRKRCLIVARHLAKVPNYLYEPPKRALRSVGDVLSKLWLPGDADAGPLHRVPSLAFKTWVRLAFVEAGSDWRSLNKLAVEDGQLRDYLLVPENTHHGVYGVQQWGETSGTVTSRSMPTTGNFCVADPRAESKREGSGFLGVQDWDKHSGTVTANGRPGAGAFSVADPRHATGAAQYQQYGVVPWSQPSGAVINVKSPGQGSFTVQDPRHQGPAKHSNEFRIVRWERPSCAVTSAHGTGQCVADPRAAGGHSKYAVTDWAEPSRTVISGSTTGQGAFAVQDPRSGLDGQRQAYLSGGHYGVLRMDEPAGAVSASACHDNGRWSVADHRMPEPNDKLVCRIRSLDGTWHRPFTTLDLSALQSLFDPEDPADIAAFTDAYVSNAASDSVHREWTGNAVPSDSAQAIAEEMLRTLMLADAGETFQLSATPVWVRPYIAALQLGESV